MNREELLELWLREYQAAHIHGWSFSHIRGKYEEGSFLLSLSHPCRNLAARKVTVFFWLPKRRKPEISC